MFQKLIVVGNLGRDPEMRYMPDGTAVTSFSMAVNRKWTSGNGTQEEEVTWFRVSVWGRQAEAANQYLRKGSQALVEGRLKPDRATGGPSLWTAQDGTVRASFEVHADSVRFLSGGTRDDDGGYSGGQGSGYSAPAAQEEDDIPF